MTEFHSGEVEGVGECTYMCHYHLKDYWYKKTKGTFGTYSVYSKKKEQAEKVMLYLFPDNENLIAKVNESNSYWCYENFMAKVNESNSY